MKKVLTWMLNHLVLIFGVVVFTITFAVIGSVMYNSYKSYKAYEEKYYQNDLDTRSLSPANPTRIEFEDDFVAFNSDGSINKTKSTYKNQLTTWAENLVVKTTQDPNFVQGSSLLDSYIPTLDKGGSISINLFLEKKSFMDIDFVISSEYSKETEDGTKYGVENLLENVDFIINGVTMEEMLNLPNSGNGVEWHHLVMGGFALPEGRVTIEIKNTNNKGSLMPQVRNISVFTSGTVTYDTVTEAAA